MNDEYFFKVSVKGLVLNEEGKLMLLKEGNGDWDIPGGSMVHGETFHQALKREIKEEMGVECEILDEKPFAVWLGQDSLGIWRIIICFRVRLLSYKFIHSDEFVDLAYFNKSDSEKINLHPLKKPVYNYI
ncbi:MAG: NUDIX hydrolase [Candidatus Doudnabacteria bacterium]